MNKALGKTFSVLGRTKKISPSSPSKAEGEKLGEEGTEKGNSLAEKGSSNTDGVEKENNTVQDNPLTGEGDDVGEESALRESSSTPTSGKARKPRSSITNN